MADPRHSSIGQDEPEFRAIIEALQGFSTILTISDAGNRILRANAAAIAFIGRAEEDVIGHPVAEFLSPASRDEVVGITVAGADDGLYGEHEFEFERPDRTTVWGRVRTIRLKDGDGRTSLRISVIEDVTEQHHGMERETTLEVAQRTSQAMVDAAVVALPVIFATFDADLRLVGVIGGHETIRLRLESGIGKTASELGWNDEILEALQAAVTGTPSTARSVAGGETYQALNAPMRNGAGDIVGVISVTTNISVDVAASAKRTQAEELALFVARHDPLTGLLGRSALIEHLSELAVSGHGARALMLIDLDDFNAINDLLGHSVGDAALLEIASRIADAFTGLIIARYGGDQFAVAAPFIVEEHEAVAAVERVHTILEPDVAVGGQKLHVTASIGLALQEIRGASSTLIRNADSALAHAKRAGHGQYRVYDDAMRSESQDRLLMQTDLRVALSSGQLRVAYQPIIALRDRRVIGAEALLRWMHPERGAISPVDFIPVAEQGGMIVPIGQWVMNTACQDMLDMHRDLGINISVNVSTRQLVGGCFAEWVGEALERTGLPPPALTIEVTEGVLIDDTGPIREAFEALRARGVQVAIDDFGTGFSSLARLQRLPVDVIKLDRAFVTDIDSRPEARGLAGAILQVGAAIGASVVAEGIETEAEALTLLDIGYTMAQGFLFARPMAIEHLRQRIARGTVRSAA